MDNPSQEIYEMEETQYYFPNGNPIGLDEPLKLTIAIEIVFKNQISPALLQAQAKRGKLELERIGNKDFVTIRSLNAMRELCRVKRNPQDSLPVKLEQISNTSTSLTEENNRQLDIQMKILDELERDLMNT